MGTVTRIYKNKGTKGKCSNERGITVSSNFGKLFERIINDRAKKVTNVSDAQSGGKEQRSTTDHLLILKELIRDQKRKRHPLYLVFLDVTKAFDKAWLDGIMHAMHNNGLTGPLWNITRKMNLNLKATIKTKHGLTRPISIRDSIRQGGVLSGLQYALVMDEIAKEITKTNKGCPIPGNPNDKLGCLLWMDDVVLVTNNELEIQELLDITHATAGKYHIEFGQEKSKYMTIGTNKELTLNLGAMKIEKAKVYKYLGEIIHEKMSLDPNIKAAKSKAEGAYQTILAIAGDPLLKGIQMETIWKLVETCITPIITYGAETWETTKKETKTTNQILDNILKRILKVPNSTPREALYIETGIIDIEHTIKKLRIGMLHRLDKTKNVLIDKILQNQHDKAWSKITKLIAEEIGIKSDIIPSLSSNSIKKEIKRAVDLNFHSNISKAANEKSKIKHLLEGIGSWTPGTRPIYMSKLNRTQTSSIFKARTRMLPVKNNYRCQYKDNICRGCKAETETQQHVLENCRGIHSNNETKVPASHYFTEDVQLLTKASENIQLICNILAQSDVPVAPTGNIPRPGNRTHTR